MILGYTHTKNRVISYTVLSGDDCALFCQEPQTFFVSCLLVDPDLGVGLVGHELLGLEPEGDLAVGALDAVGAVADVASDVDGVVAADGAGERVGGVGGAEENAAALDDVEALPDHTDDGAGGEVLAETAVEGLSGEVNVVGLGLLEGGVDHLEGNELVALALEAGDDLAGEAALDAVGLDSDEGTLGLGGHDFCCGSGYCVGRRGSVHFQSQPRSLFSIEQLQQTKRKMACVCAMRLCFFFFFFFFFFFGGRGLFALKPHANISQTGIKCAITAQVLLVDPDLGVGLVGHELLGLEPEGDLAVGALDAVGAVADVASDVDGVVAADGAGERVGGVGGAEENAAALDDVEALPDHTDDGAGGEVLAETAVEGLSGEVNVVGLGLLEGGVDHLEGNELVALALEAGDDLAGEAALDAVGLDSDEGTLGLGGHDCLLRKWFDK